MKKKLMITIMMGILIVFQCSHKPVNAASSADVLYTKAYEATNRALSEKTQKSINSARSAVAALSGTSAKWAIGEFSRQLDLIQHPILVKVIDAINTAKADPIQKNLDAAKESIDLDLPLEWRNSYSSAVDLLQQAVMKKAVEAANKAASSQLQQDVDYVNSLLSEIQTSTNNSIAEWAKAMKQQVKNSMPYNMYIKVRGDEVVIDNIYNSEMNFVIESNPLVDKKIKYGKAKVVINIIKGDAKSVQLNGAEYNYSTGTFTKHDILSEPWMPEGGVTIDRLGYYGRPMEAKFLKTGPYTIQYSLIEIDTNRVITTYNQEIVVKTSAEVDKSKPIFTILSKQDNDGNGKIDTIVCKANKATLNYSPLSQFRLIGDGIREIPHGITTNTSTDEFILYFREEKYPDGAILRNGNDISINASDIKVEYVGSVLLVEPSDSEAIITFKDKNLELAIRDSINKPVGDLTKGDVSKITNLGLINKSITDLSGLENLYNLESIFLRGNNITDISPLMKLKNLVEVNLSATPVSESDKQALRNALPDLYLPN